MWAELANNLRSKPNYNDLGLATFLAQQGYALIRADKPTNAEPILRESLSIREKKEPDSWETFCIKSLLGGSRLDQKKYAEAEPLLLSGYEGMKQRHSKAESYWFPQDRLIEAMERLVRLYEAMGKADAAAKWRKEMEAAKAAMP